MKSIAVIGLGLIGCSLIRALRDVNQVASVVGYDRDPRQCTDALSMGIVDRVAEDPANAVSGAEFVVIAVPVLHTRDALESIKGHIGSKAVLTDVGSTKSSVLVDVEAVFGAIPGRFVAGHPIAGTEQSGAAASRPDLFRNRRVVLTPHQSQDPGALAMVRSIWEAIGSRVVEMQAKEHDAIFAATSHLPHVLAYAFVDMLTRLDNADEIFPNAGGGFRDFTRIASSSPEMWHDIVRANKPEVTALLERQIGELQQLLDMMQADQWPALQERFARARAAREKYLSQIE